MDAAPGLLLYLAIVVIVIVALIATEFAFILGLPYTLRFSEM